LTSKEKGGEVLGPVSRKKKKRAGRASLEKDVKRCLDHQRDLHKRSFEHIKDAREGRRKASISKKLSGGDEPFFARPKLRESLVLPRQEEGQSSAILASFANDLEGRKELISARGRLEENPKKGRKESEPLDAIVSLSVSAANSAEGEGWPEAPFLFHQAQGKEEGERPLLHSIGSTKRREKTRRCVITLPVRLKGGKGYHDRGSSFSIGGGRALI